MGQQIKTLKDMKAVAPMFGPEAVKFVQIKIDQSPNGEDEEIIAHDTQVMFLLMELADRATAMEGRPV